MLLAFVATIMVFIAYVAPLSLELTEMVGDKTSGAEVIIRDVAMRGPNSVLDPQGRRASPFASASRATLSFFLRSSLRWWSMLKILREFSCSAAASIEFN